jgi:NADH dehydrogenase [ubiquinone] 1 alpha subcomplex assembly factor 6
MQDRERFIAELVRRDDRDRFLTALFVPADRRADVLALYAFNAELARIRTSVSETLIGRMKLQWWRDVIDSIYAGRGGPQGNPVTEALENTISSRKLSRAHFEAIIATRERDMDNDEAGFTFADTLDLEGYAEGTASRLIDLALEILGATTEANTVAARHVGIGYALTGILRAVLFHAAENRLLLPKAELAATGVTGVQDLQSPKNTKAIAATIAAIATSAEAHLQAARAQTVSRAACPALLGAAIASQYLDVLKRADYDLGNPRIIHLRASVLRLVWAAARGKF